MQTTAQHREMARRAEQSCDWLMAAHHWNAAIRLYPSTGALAELDKAKMATRRDACTGILATA